jgi:hypothetical protein
MNNSELISKKSLSNESPSKLCTIKLQQNEDVRRVKVSKNISFVDLVELVKSLFKVTENLTLKYIDSENDECTVSGDLELREAFMAKKNSEILRFKLSFSQKSAKKTPPSFVFLEKIGEHTQQPQQQPRRCWPERINQRRMQILGIHEEAIQLMDAKKYEEAKTLLETQAEMQKNCPWKKSVPLYNIACCEALLGNVDSALAYLTQAVNNGYRNVQHIEQDPDLNILHGLDAFEILLSELKENQPKRGRWRTPCKNQEIRTTYEVKNDSNKAVLPEVKVPIVEFKTEAPQTLPEKKKVEMQPSTQPELAVNQPAGDKSSELISFDETSVVDIKPTIESIVEVKSEIQPEIPEEETYQSELRSLYQMGFTNEQQNFEVLKLTKGNLSEAVVLLLQ